MKIMVTNDDGIWADGINVLAKTLLEHGYEITVVAPDRPKSASSHAITLDMILPLREVKMPCGCKGYAVVNGSPSDCVLIGIGDIVKDADIIISGINHGANVGHDILYSGTVAAAIEGILHGIPSIAVSVDSWEGEYADSAANVVIDLLKSGIHSILSSRFVLNVNVPSIPKDNIVGYKLTRMGGPAFEDWVVKRVDPRGRVYYWLDGRPIYEDEEDTDIWAIKHGYVSLTPISLDMTGYEYMDVIKDFLNKLSTD